MCRNRNGKIFFSRKKDIQDFKCAVNSGSGSKENPQTYKKRDRNQYVLQFCCNFITFAKDRKKNKKIFIYWNYYFHYTISGAYLAPIALSKRSSDSKNSFQSVCRSRGSSPFLPGIIAHLPKEVLKSFHNLILAPPSYFSYHILFSPLLCSLQSLSVVCFFPCQGTFLNPYPAAFFPLIFSTEFSSQSD